MPPTALYTPENCNAAYQLNWSLSLFGRGPLADPGTWIDEVKDAVEPDGVRLLEHHLAGTNVIQFLVSTKPDVSPAEIIRSVKGRVQHAIRATQPRAFRRNYFIQSVGSAHRQVLEGEPVGPPSDGRSSRAGSAQAVRD